MNRLELPSLISRLAKPFLVPGLSPFLNADPLWGHGGSNGGFGVTWLTLNSMPRFSKCGRKCWFKRLTTSAGVCSTSDASFTRLAINPNSASDDARIDSTHNDPHSNLCFVWFAKPISATRIRRLPWGIAPLFIPPFSTPPQWAQTLCLRGGRSTQSCLIWNQDSTCDWHLEGPQNEFSR